MSEFKLSDLLPRLDGWEVVSVVQQGEISEIRVANAVESAPDWAVARAAIFVADFPGEAGGESVVGSVLQVDSTGISAGPWSAGEDLLVAGQMLESAIIVVPNDSLDPVKEPASTADLILGSGSLVWPTVADLPEDLRGLELLEGITRLALAQPSLLISVVAEAEAGTARAFDTFVTPFGAVETERHLESEDPMAVSYFPLSDLPSRMWERTGVTRLIRPGTPTNGAQKVAARSTFMDERGLVAGALSWEESSEGELTTEDGPIAPFSLASELLRMLPGGDIDFESAGKGVVGEG